MSAESARFNSMLGIFDYKIQPAFPDVGRPAERHFGPVIFRQVDPFKIDSIAVDYERTVTSSNVLEIAIAKMRREVKDHVATAAPVSEQCNRDDDHYDLDKALLHW